jgi:serine/threonine-protein kinase PRP4
MHTAGKKEIDVLTRLGQEDPEGKKHICKLLSHFEYKGHLCMVFQPMEMNLRKLLKTYGREVGITLTAIRMYARQMFHGLLHMQKCNVLHGDIKLDNILISKDLKNVAICDFGTADWSHEATITPYMVSRYYRPPEICLGLRYSFAMDLWSVGVCLFELYTGKFMFTGRNNNEMLKQFLVSSSPSDRCICGLRSGCQSSYVVAPRVCCSLLASWHVLFLFSKISMTSTCAKGQHPVVTASKSSKRV